AWTSSGQMRRRFEFARAIVSGNAGVFDAVAGGGAGAGAGGTGFPMLSNRLYFEGVEATLSARTLEALKSAASQAEWNTYLLSSPEFNYY
ncbi:MAG: DUF1800 domain-containing protein, partial [Steroidobacterales bacterium]